MAPIQGDFFLNSSMDFHYQQQRRMSGPLSHTMPAVKQPLSNGHRFSNRTTPMPSLHIPQQQSVFNHQTTPDHSVSNQFHTPYPQKQTVRQVLSAPIQQTQHNPLNLAMLQRRDSVPAMQQEGELVRYKTELCRPFEETGNCRYGSKCQFAHGLRELRSLARHPKYKTTLCRTFHKTGLCSYGHRCNFIHDEAGFNTELLNSNPLEQRAARPHVLPLGIGVNIINSTSDSPASSLTSGSPTASPCFLNDEIFQSFSPSPSSNSDEDLLHYKLGFDSTYASDAWLSDIGRDLITNLNNLVLN